jgi:hypothetical protein
MGLGSHDTTLAQMGFWKERLLGAFRGFRKLKDTNISDFDIAAKFENVQHQKLIAPSDYLQTCFCHDHFLFPAFPDVR